MQTQNIPIKQIKPYSKNAKKHPDEQVALIANSIKEFGWQQPLVVDKDNNLKEHNNTREQVVMAEIDTKFMKANRALIKDTGLKIKKKTTKTAVKKTTAKKK